MEDQTLNYQTMKNPHGQTETAIYMIGCCTCLDLAVILVIHVQFLGTVYINVQSWAWLLYGQEMVGGSGEAHGGNRMIFQ